MSRICISILRCHPISTRPIISIRTLFNSRAFSSKHQKNESPAAGLQSYKGDQQISADVRPIGEKVKETAKTTSYLGVILLGVGVTGAMFYTIFKELFSSQSPNNIYAKALDQCINDTRVEDLLGAPIKGFGEESRRGRRGHVSHTLFMQNGLKHLRMRFYIKGSRNRATVHLEMQENAGKYEYKYLIVQLDDYSRRTIVLENNTIKKEDLIPTNSELDNFI